MANIRALLGIYYGVKKTDPTSKVAMKTEQGTVSEDEGEVISSDEDAEGSPKATEFKPLKTSSVKDQDDAKKIE